MVKSNFAKDSIIVGVKENVGFAFNKIKKLYPLHILMISVMSNISLLLINLIHYALLLFLISTWSISYYFIEN